MFAVAGTENIVLIGWIRQTLEEMGNLVFEASPSSQPPIYCTDVSHLKDMPLIASEVGTSNIYLLNAGYCATPTPIAATDTDDYWKAYERKSLPLELIHC